MGTRTADTYRGCTYYCYANFGVLPMELLTRAILTMAVPTVAVLPVVLLAMATRYGRTCYEYTCYGGACGWLYFTMALLVLYLVWPRLRLAMPKWKARRSSSTTSPAACTVGTRRMDMGHTGHMGHMGLQIIDDIR